MTAPDTPTAGFWLAGRFTPGQVDRMVVGTTVLVSVSGLTWLTMASHPGSPLAGVALLPFTTVPLLWRRSRPGRVLVVLTAAFAVSMVVRSAMPDGLGMVFGGYAAALYGRPGARLAAGTVAAAALAGAFLAVLGTDNVRAVGHLTAFAFGYGVAWVLGDRTRSRRAYLAELAERARRMARERDAHARRAAEQERNRIARELHDVVAHNVSVIAVQAGAARRTSRSNPEQAGETLGLIERTARGTLAELRALLGVLRRDGDAPPLLRPLPGLDRLDELVGKARDAGVRIQTRVHGEVRPLAAVVDLCAYRFVQEALTNVIKHAPGANAHLLIHYRERELSITVVDDGPGRGGAEPAGLGLIGMRERVTLAGGELHTGPALGGGFRVAARLPLVADPVGAPAADPASA